MTLSNDYSFTIEDYCLWNYNLIEAYGYHDNKGVTFDNPNQYCLGVFNYIRHAQNCADYEFHLSYNHEDEKTKHLPFGLKKAITPVFDKRIIQVCNSVVHRSLTDAYSKCCKPDAPFQQFEGHIQGRSQTLNDSANPEWRHMYALGSASQR